MTERVGRGETERVQRDRGSAERQREFRETERVKRASVSEE